MTKAGISKLAMVVAVTAVAAVASIAVFSWLGFISFESEEWVHFYDPDSLVTGSNTIIVGRLIYEQRITAPPDNRDDAAVSSSDTFVYAKYDVLESLKGPLAVGDSIFTVTKEGSTGGFFNHWSETVQLENDTVYVLFIKPGQRIANHSAEYGDVVWSAAGEPGIAQLAGDRLHFVALASYVNDVRDKRLDRPWPESAAPFRLTKAELIEIIAIQSGKPTPGPKMFLRETLPRVVDHSPG